MRFHTPLLASSLLILSSTSLLAASVTGNWYTYGAKSMVKITKCGAGLCGKIVWLRQGLDSEGRPVRDERNLDKRYRTRQVLGLATFSGLAPAGPKRWSGLMYNPDDGRNYKGSLTFVSSGSIRVEGCRIGGGPCGMRSWTRANTKITGRIKTRQALLRCARFQSDTARHLRSRYAQMDPRLRGGDEGGEAPSRHYSAHHLRKITLGIEPFCAPSRLMG